MWQRIQTVFLVVAVLSLVASIFVPIWVFEEDAKRQVLYALHYSVKENDVLTPTYFPYSLTAILLVAAATVAVISIRKYKDRMAQMKLGALNSLFIAASIGSAVYFASTLVKLYPAGEYGPGLWLPGVAVVCNLLANRFIRRDEKIVRDSERLR